MKNVFAISLTLMFLILFSCQKSGNENDKTDISQTNNKKRTGKVIVRNAVPNEPLSILLQKEKNKKGNDEKVIWLSIDKKKFELSVMFGSNVLKTYPMVLGFNKKDDKRKEGDGCTPEGEFKVLSKYKHNKWSRFIWVNYPTEDSQKKHDADKKSGKISAEATIGSEIGIHGVPNKNDAIIDEYNHWTLGCVSLKTPHIIEIYDFVEKETRIKIQ